jgi:hypothetical protein
LNEHAHAPYYALVQELNKGEGRDGDVMEEVLRRQMFNWLPGGEAEYKSLERFSMLSRTNVGLLWNCTVPEQDVVQIHASWYDAQLKLEEIKDVLKEVVDVAEALAREGSWGKRISEL